jgi:predicted GNAT family acetyltransferase
MTDITVTNNEAQQHYQARIDGSVARLEYERRGDNLVLLHTEVPEALGGRGVGNVLAQAALEDARARNLTVVPLCPFVNAYLRKHPEHLGVVEPNHRARLEQTS